MLLIPEVSGMAKRPTKRQVKRLYMDILSKAKRLWMDAPQDGLNAKDFMAIERIISRYLKKL